MFTLPPPTPTPTHYPLPSLGISSSLFTTTCSAEVTIDALDTVLPGPHDSATPPTPGNAIHSPLYIFISPLLMPGSKPLCTTYRPGPDATHTSNMCTRPHLHILIIHGVVIAICGRWRCVVHASLAVVPVCLRQSFDLKFFWASHTPIKG